MNTAELLDQFIVEARECLQTIGQRLLDVERTPGDAALLDDLFRQVHTLKGNCGLFEFRALEQVVHAGEDVLDRVRHGELAYAPAIADALLEAMDYTAELIDGIAATGSLPANAVPRADALARALRAHLRQATAGAAAAANAPGTAATASGPEPRWLAALPAALRGSRTTALRYLPEADCFFKGEDPWRLACETPGLLHLAVLPREPWPAADGFDCYRCNLELLIASDAAAPQLDDHFRYVGEQLQRHPFAAAVPPAAPAALRERVGMLWDAQIALLAQPAPDEASCRAAQAVLGRLLDALAGPDDEAPRVPLPQPATPAVLAAWARAHHPLGAAPAAASGAAPAEPRRPPGAAEEGPRVLKVAQDKLDRLMDLIGEIVVAKNALPYLAERAETVFQQRDLAREIKNQYTVINRIAEDMQHAIMQVRMLPVGTVFQRFERLVRDISRKLGKEVRLVVEGEQTEADKNVIESLADPLIHILRNSLDHGIELPAARRAAGKPAQGTLRVAARQEGDRVLIDIEDDGAGIDAARVRAKAVERGLVPAERAGTLGDSEAVQLVFLPGFSTAEAITDLSGRGVGMDVVRSAVERVGGSVALRSQAGRGTQITLALPLSMAVTRVMTVEAGGRRFGVPMDLVVETVRIDANEVHRVKNAQTAVLRGRVVPLRTLHSLLALDGGPQANAEGELAVLVIRLGGEPIGLFVDDFHGAGDIILKPLEGVLAGLTGLAGTALMGDGSVLMVLNPKELI